MIPSIVIWLHFFWLGEFPPPTLYFQYVNGRGMDVGRVVALISGQGLILASVRVLEYGLAAWLTMHLFVVFYEEPTLRRKFGADL